MVRPVALAATVLALSAPRLLAQEGSPVPDPGLREGHDLYLGNCARCHGPEGRGDTDLVLTPPPRNLREGRFSFGNTPDAIFDTVSGGIPGTAMPAFDGVLNREQRLRLVQYVSAWIPSSDASTAASVVVVGETPKVVRGYLPPLPGQDLALARGLLIGLPGGFSFQYRTDDVRLMKVYRGGFVDRRDWAGRGGTALGPLGDLFYALGEGDPEPPFSQATGSELLPLRGQLASSWVRGGAAGLSYELRDGSGRAVAHVDEWNQLESVTGALGFSRHFALSGAETGPALVVDLAARARDASWIRGRSDEWTGRAEPHAVPGTSSHWLVRQQPGGSYEYVRLELPEGAELVDGDQALAVKLELGEQPRALRATILLAPAFSEDLLERMTGELRP